MGILRLAKRVHSVIREKVKDHARSPHWRKARKDFLATHSSCAGCGGTQWLQVHHERPFHLDPALELDPRNFITLCGGKTECHLLIGHGDDFKAFNPQVRQHAAYALAHPSERAKVAAWAKTGRQYAEGGV